MGPEPVIGEGAELNEALLGAYTQIGEHSRLNEAAFGGKAR